MAEFFPRHKEVPAVPWRTGGRSGIAFWSMFWLVGCGSIEVRNDEMDDLSFLGRWEASLYRASNSREPLAWSRSEQLWDHFDDSAVNLRCILLLLDPMILSISYTQTSKVRRRDYDLMVNIDPLLQSQRQHSISSSQTSEHEFWTSTWLLIHGSGWDSCKNALMQSRGRLWLRHEANYYAKEG